MMGKLAGDSRSRVWTVVDSEGLASRPLCHTGGTEDPE